MPIREQHWKIARCFVPVLGVFLGLLLGWILQALAELHDPLIDILMRTNTFLFGVAGWAAATVKQGKQLHCGGTLDLDSESKTRYLALFVSCLFLFVLAVVFAIKGMALWGFPTSALIIALLAGEIGWGKPLIGIIYFVRF